ncbi:sporulation protein [Bacillus sp. FJAT-27225]|uniref:sigma-G-dependent sporulation-specific acid-soluble spore protein CsgA n=1 Tax=Bacillus sp. FJAT-27225 TaxID=1743144 RepID=UPI00080C2124|nr:sigma-G-dependent sporulation-specific acid-soluble spore protein CsgA [Bacillus sp. FJAT-27225]OCA90763.1 sporulation protein [Bacillus sp. FJAT-27225]
MDQSLQYLREIISNYTEGHGQGKRIYDMLEKNFTSEEEFVRSLSDKDIQFLNSILPEEINYARDEQDDLRANHLNNVYEQLI